MTQPTPLHSKVARAAQRAAQAHADAHATIHHRTHKHAAARAKRLEMEQANRNVAGSGSPPPG